MLHSRQYGMSFFCESTIKDFPETLDDVYFSYHSVPLSRTEIKIHGLSVFPNTDDLTQTDKISPSSWYPSGSSKRRAESCPWSEQNSWRSYWIEQKYVTLPASSDILNHLLGGRGVSTRGIVLGLLFLPLKFLKDPFQVVGVVVGVVPYVEAEVVVADYDTADHGIPVSGIERQQIIVILRGKSPYLQYQTWLQVHLSHRLPC